MRLIFVFTALLQCPGPPDIEAVASPAARFAPWSCLRARTADNGGLALSLDGLPGRLYFDFEDDAVTFLHATRLNCPG